MVLGDIIMDSGLPEGGLSVLPCNAEIAEKIITDDRIKAYGYEF